MYILCAVKDRQTVIWRGDLQAHCHDDLIMKTRFVIGSVFSNANEEEGHAEEDGHGRDDEHEALNFLVDQRLHVLRLDRILEMRPMTVRSPMFTTTQCSSGWARVRRREGSWSRAGSRPCIRPCERWSVSGKSCLLHLHVFKDYHANVVAILAGLDLDDVALADVLGFNLCPLAFAQDSRLGRKHQRKLAMRSFFFSSNVENSRDCDDTEHDAGKGCRRALIQDVLNEAENCAAHRRRLKPVCVSNSLRISDFSLGGVSWLKPWVSCFSVTCALVRPVAGSTP